MITFLIIYFIIGLFFFYVGMSYNPIVNYNIKNYNKILYIFFMYIIFGLLYPIIIVLGFRQLIKELRKR